MFRINFNTGAGNVENIESLEEAMKTADEGACYTQKNIDVYDGDVLVASRSWYGTKFDPDLYEDGEDADVIRFGDSGYYDEWVMM